MTRPSHRLMDALASALRDLTNDGQTHRLDDTGIMAYQKDRLLYLEWGDGFTVCKPLREVAP